jgi:hypothetical protein
MEKIHRSSIFGSKLFFLYFFLFVLTGTALVEGIYRFNRIPVDYGELIPGRITNDTGKIMLILGDSRAQSGISTDELQSMFPGFRVYNLGLQGASVYTQAESLNSFSKPPACVLLCISPADVFGGFVEAAAVSNTGPKDIISVPVDQLFQRHIPLYPVRTLDHFISQRLQQTFRFPYGLPGFAETLYYGRVSVYTTRTGWRSITRLGSDEYYTKVVNQNGYAKYLLKNNADSVFIQSCKDRFSSLLAELGNKGIKVLLVRTPVDTGMLAIENDKFPWFDDYAEMISREYNIGYCKGLPGFRYSDFHADGSHLSSDQARQFTIQLAGLYHSYIKE